MLGIGTSKPKGLKALILVSVSKMTQNPPKLFPEGFISKPVVYDRPVPCLFGWSLRTLTAFSTV